MNKRKQKNQIRKLNTIAGRTIFRQPAAFYIWHTLMILTMVVIFCFSGQNGDQSREVSEGTMELILMKFSGILPAFFLNWLAVWIRKVAHYLVYLILGFDAACMMQCRKTKRDKEQRKKEQDKEQRKKEQDKEQRKKEQDKEQRKKEQDKEQDKEQRKTTDHDSTLWDRNLRNVLYGWTIAVLYACTDEIHQLFVPERAGMLRDVMLDSCGAICGAGMSLCVFLLLRKLIPKNRV